MGIVRRILSDIEDTLWIIDPESAVQAGARCPPNVRVRAAISRVMKFAQVYSDTDRTKAAAWHVPDTNKSV